MRRLLAYLIGVVILASCASSHDLSKGRSLHGGGFRVGELRPGLFGIVAKTNVGQMEMIGTARRMWSKHADIACGAGNYAELQVREHSYDDVPPINAFRYIVTVKDGFALCRSSGLSEWEALEEIGSRSPDAGKWGG